MTNFNSIFGELAKFDKMFVGYDRVINQMQKANEQLTKAIPNYPPYNIAKVDDNKYVIEMAVAGFGKHNLDIELANNTLTISGHTATDDSNEGSNYLYKGISERNFKRAFQLSDSIEIKNAELFNGMLRVWLENIIPEDKKPKKIDINSSEQTSSNKQLLTEEKGK